MKLFLAVAMSVAVVSLGPPAEARAHSQDDKDSPLAALAKKTKKKKTDPGESRVIGRQELRTTRSRVTIPPAGSSAAAAPGAAADTEAAPAGGDADAPAGEGAVEGEAAEPEKTPAELRSDEQAALQEQVDQQRWLISELEKKKAEAQAELSDSMTLVPGSPRRTTLLQLVENCDTQIAEAQKKIADLRTQARRAGVAVR